MLLYVINKKSSGEHFLFDTRLSTIKLHLLIIGLEKCCQTLTRNESTNISCVLIV